MKHYFLIAKDVGDLTAILCADLEDRQAKPVAMLNRFVARFRPRKSRTLPDTTDFVVDKNRITISDPDVFQRDPVNLIRIFHVAQRHSLAFHPDAMRAATRSLKLIDKKLRDDPEANRLFLEILTAKNDAEIVLRRMNEVGVLGRFIPDFGRVVAMMQFNMYHHYTVDEHLLRCIGVLTDIERGEKDEFRARQRADDDDPAAAPHAALRRAVSARHRQGPHRGPFDRGRAHRAAAVPALRLLAPPTPRRSPG